MVKWVKALVARNRERDRLHSSIEINTAALLEVIEVPLSCERGRSAFNEEVRAIYREFLEQGKRLMKLSKTRGLIETLLFGSKASKQLQRVREFQRQVAEAIHGPNHLLAF